MCNSTSWNISDVIEVIDQWGGSFPCNTDAIFIVFNNSFNSVIILLFRDPYPPQEQPLVPRPRGFFTWNRHERYLLLLIFFIDSHAILSTHRVHGTSADWCFSNSIVQWYTSSGVLLPPYPRPIKLLCCRCFLNFRRVQDLHVPCYWCEMLQGMGYPPRS